MKESCDFLSPMSRVKAVLCAACCLSQACGDDSECVDKSNRTCVASEDAGGIRACDGREPSIEAELASSFVATCLADEMLTSEATIADLRFDVTSGAVIGGLLRLSSGARSPYCEAETPVAIQFSNRPQAIPLPFEEGQRVGVEVTGHRSLGPTNELLFVVVRDLRGGLLTATFDQFVEGSEVDTGSLPMSATAFDECEVRTDAGCFETQIRLGMDVRTSEGIAIRFAAYDTMRLELEGQTYAMRFSNSLDSRGITGECPDVREGRRLGFSLVLAP